MRYRITPGKRKVTGPDGAEKEESILTLDIWPDPWALEKTDPALCRRRVLPMTEAGRDEIETILRETFAAEEQAWKNCPGILDCEPWSPPAEENAPSPKV